jgi:hypothetical protein
MTLSAALGICPPQPLSDFRTSRNVTASPGAGAPDPPIWRSRCMPAPGSGYAHIRLFCGQLAWEAYRSVAERCVSRAAVSGMPVGP